MAISYDAQRNVYTELIIFKLLQKCNIKYMLAKAVAIVKSHGIIVHF